MAISVFNYSEYVKNLKELGKAKKATPPKVSPKKFYPSKSELEATQLLENELEDYAKKLQKASKFGVDGVYGVPGAVPKDFEDETVKIAKSVATYQSLAFAEFSDLKIGERFFPSVSDKDEILTTWSANFVNLCKSTNEEMRKKVAGIISDGVLGGRNIRELSQNIENVCSDFSRTKSELIATTEVGKLNTSIARKQSESVGIDYYEWGAAMDGRTRDSHAVMDGKICKWGDDTHYYKWEVNQQTGKRNSQPTRLPRPANAFKGAPGTDFRCRCVAMPYVPEYEDEYEEQRPKGPVLGVTQEHHVEVQPSKQTLELERKLALSKKADERHAMRTAEQEQAIIEKWNERNRKRRIAEIAEKRHAERNAEAIIAERDKRLKVRAEGRKLLAQMSGIYGVDTEPLQKALETGNTESIQKAMKPLTKIKKDIEKTRRYD